MFLYHRMDNNRDLIRLEIEQIKNQVQLLEDIFEDLDKHYENRLSVCDDIFFSIKYYYDHLLHKFGFCDCKKE